MRLGAAVCLLGLASAGCEAGPANDAGADARPGFEEEAARIMAAAMDRIQERADSLDDRLQPVPLLRPGDRSAMRRYLNEAHLARARALGVRPASEAAIPALVEEGRLVQLEDSTEHWVIRELDHSVPYVTSDVRALLVDIGDRFHARLDSLGLPPFRFEISSLLRTPEQQADLRSGNPNATGGTSAHELGTTVDIPYSAYAAPADPIVDVAIEEAPWLRPAVRRVADGMAELVAARRSRELMAIMGQVLLELQAEGRVYITLEVQQPVYHITVAARTAQ